jgi:hypothetical protein
MSEALNERGLLEERYGALYKSIETANDPAARKRLLRNLDDVVGERLALEGDHAEEFRVTDAHLFEPAAVQPEADF